MFDLGTFDNATFDFAQLSAGTVASGGDVVPGDPFKKKRKHRQEYIGDDPQEYEDLLTEVSNNFETPAAELLADQNQIVLLETKPKIIQKLWDEDDEEVLLLI